MPVDNFLFSHFKMSTETTLVFSPFTTAVEPNFWHALTQKKLEEYRLDDKMQQISGLFTNCRSYGCVVNNDALYCHCFAFFLASSPDIPPIFNLNYAAFNR